MTWNSFLGNIWSAILTTAKLNNFHKIVNCSKSVVHILLIINLNSTLPCQDIELQYVMRSLPSNRVKKDYGLLKLKNATF